MRLQPRDKLCAKRCTGRSDSAFTVILGKAKRGFGDHLGCRSIARVLVALHRIERTLAIGIFADKQYVIKAIFALFLGRAFAGFRPPFAKWCLDGFGQPLGSLLAHLAGAGQHHLVIAQVRTPGVAEQEVRPVDILGVDRRHDEQPGVRPNGLSI